MTLTTPDLGRRSREQRFNPLRQLTPAKLTAALDSFEAGYLRQAAQIWELIEDRDDTVKIAAPKRRKSVSRQNWDVLKLEDSPEAERDAEALRFFYNNLTATSAVDLNVRGGFRRLINQMMTAEFYQYAAHEVVWQPKKNAEGRQLLTAEFRFVPLYFFENRTGQLRYTGPDGLVDGQALDRDGWMITSGEGLHKAISICRTLKQLSLQDWVNFSEKFGLPGVHGKTSAAKGTQEWNDFAESLAAFANDWITLSGEGTTISLIETGKTGDAPFAPMVERMDRRITALCRGADLGTLSSQDGAGASLQDDETNLLLEDDCENITETLNTQVDRFVLRWLNGPDHEPRAYIKLKPPVKRDTKLEIEVDDHLLNHGGELDAAETYERFGRALPENLKGLRLKAVVPAPQALPGSAPAAPVAALANDTSAAVAGALGVPATWLAPVADLLASLEKQAADGGLSDADLVAGLESAARELPEIFKNLNQADLRTVLEASFGRSVMRGQASAPEAKSKK